MIRSEPAAPVCVICNGNAAAIAEHPTPAPCYFLSSYRGEDPPDALCSGCATVGELFNDPEGAGWLARCLAALLSSANAVETEELAAQIAGDIMGHRNGLTGTPDSLGQLKARIIRHLKGELAP